VFAVEGTRCPVTDRCSGSTVRHTRAKPNLSCLIIAFYFLFCLFSCLSIFCLYNGLDVDIIASPTYTCINMVKGKGHPVKDPPQSGEFLKFCVSGMSECVCVPDTV